MDPAELWEPFKALLFSMPRWMGFMVIFPMLNPKAVTMPVTHSVTVLMACMVSPLVHAELPPVLPFLSTVVIVGKEVFVGVLIGFFAGAMFWAVDSLGALIDQQTGASMGGMIDPISGHPEGPTGGFLIQLVSVLLLTSSGFLMLLAVIFDSYSVWPVFEPWPNFATSFDSLMMSYFSGLFDMILKLAAPVLALLLLIELSLGLVQRQMPTLNVFFFSLPLKQGAAILMLALMLGMLGQTLVDEMSPAGMVRALLRIH